MQKYTNNAETTLASSIANNTTTISVNSAAKPFPSIASPDFFVVTLGVYPVIEVIKVTAKSGNTWTVQRGQESTSAQLWDADTPVKLLLTAGGVGSFVQNAPATVSTDLPGPLAINIQSGRTANDSVASGNNAIVLGYDTKATGLHAVAIGNTAAATDAEALAIGAAATASASNATAVGQGTIASAVAATALGDSSQATGIYSVAVGAGAVASTSNAVAIGSSAVASENTAVALQATAKGYKSFAAGSGSFVFGANSTALNGGYVAPDSAIGAGGFWLIPADKGYGQTENLSSGAPAVFATPVMDLGVAPVWQDNHSYTNGQVVRPTAGGAVQYRMLITPGTDLLHPAVLSNGSQPTWPGAGAVVSEGSGSPVAEWIGIDLTAGYDTFVFPVWMTFYLTALKFICYEFSTLASSPTISVGTPADSTALISSIAVSPTAEGQIYSIAVPNPCTAINNTAIRIKRLTTPASGKAMGRFLLEGYFVETLVRS